MPAKESSFVRTHFASILLIQAVVYAVLWLYDEFVASYVTLVFPAMILLILVLALIADWIEPSRIPAWYYTLMIASILIPICIGAIFYFIYDGRIEWLEGR